MSPNALPIDPVLLPPDALREAAVAGHGIMPLRLSGVGLMVHGKALLADVDVTLSAGSRTVILGPNGAGKSLFLRLCHGLLAPTSGRVEWMGPAADAVASRQAMVLQRPVMLRRSVEANIRYALEIRGVAKNVVADRVRQAIEMSGLTAISRRNARVLSGGEQQRVALARAWALAPEVLFLDEPTANLDPAAVRAVEGIVHAIAQAGTTIVMTTHDLGQARRLAEVVLFMHNGRLLERAAATTFFNSPVTAAAAAFLRGELPW
jgi:tungstate transport system ATP-binding protein